MGGSVRGGHIHGQFPDILTEASDLMLSRGRIIPTSGWESMWYGISQWMGVSHENMATILPNKDNFGPIGTTVLTDKQLFNCNITECSEAEPEPEPEPCHSTTEYYAPVGSTEKFSVTNSYGNITTKAVPEMINRNGVVIGVTSVCEELLWEPEMQVDVDGTGVIRLVPASSYGGLVGVTGSDLESSGAGACSAGSRLAPGFQTFPVIVSAALLQAGAPLRSVVLGNAALAMLRQAAAQQDPDEQIHIVIYHSPEKVYNMTIGADGAAEIVYDAPPDPVHCAGSWTEFTTCSADCGGGRESRTWNVITPAQHGGDTCDRDDGTTAGRNCNEQLCPIDCGGNWSAWGSCSAATCGGGSRDATYGVITPSSNGGSDATCEATDGATKQEPCNTQPCPMDCVGAFSTWSACSDGCGGGTRSRTFAVTQAAAHGGSSASCEAADGAAESEPCNTQACTSMDGAESNGATGNDCAGGWSAYVACSATCGGGTRSRTFSVTSAAVSGGTACAAADGATESEACNGSPCSVDCVGSWSTFGACDAVCGSGSQSRTYTVSTPATNGGSASTCAASDGTVENTACSVATVCSPPAVNCVGSWGSFSACDRTCGSGSQSRVFAVTTIVENGGVTCEVSDGSVEYTTCNTDACPVSVPSVDCSGSWRIWSQCSMTCGGGTRQRSYAVQTAASGGGTTSSCDATDGFVQSEACNVAACPVDCTGVWEAWSACDAPCGTGSESRAFTVTTAAANGGSACTESDSSPMNQACNTQACSTRGVEHLLEFDLPCEQAAAADWRQTFASEMTDLLAALIGVGPLRLSPGAPTNGTMDGRLEIRRIDCGSTIVTLFVAEGEPTTAVVSQAISGLGWMAEKAVVSEVYPQQSAEEIAATGLLAGNVVLTAPLLASARFGFTVPPPARFNPPLEPDTTPSPDRDNDGCLNDDDAFPDDATRCVEDVLPPDAPGQSGDAGNDGALADGCDEGVKPEMIIIAAVATAVAALFFMCLLKRLSAKVCADDLNESPSKTYEEPEVVGTNHHHHHHHTDHKDREHHHHHHHGDAP